MLDGVVLVGESSTETFSAADGFRFRGRMYGLDAESGEILWQFFTTDPPHTGASVWTYPTVDEATGTVFFGTSNNYSDPASDTSDSVFALDVKTGEKRWSRQILADDVWAFFTHGLDGGYDYDVSTSPVLLDVGTDAEPDPLVVVAQKDGNVTALERDTGDIRWQRQVSNAGRQGGVLGNMAFDGSRLLVIGNNGTLPGPDAEGYNGEDVVPREYWPADAEPTAVLQALDPRTGSVLWARQVGSWSLSAVSIIDGVGFVAVGKGIEMFDPVTGAHLDRVALPQETSSPVVGGTGTAIVGVSGGWNANGNDLIAYDLVAE